MKPAKSIMIVASAALFLLAGMVGFYWSLPPEPQNKLIQSASSEPEPREVIFQNGSAVCHKYQLGCETAAEVADLTPEHNVAILPLADIMTYYQAPEWSVAENGRQLYLTKLQAGLCDKHKSVLHLGVNSSREYLAVYFGPNAVGAEGGVYSVTDLRIDMLTEEVQQKIRNGYFELYSEDELLGILDGFSDIE